MRTSVTETGRINQKLRTRQALIDAATELVAMGASPTLAEVAERALVSKTTAYRYFASAEALVAEVFFDRDFPTVADVLGSVDEAGARVLAVEEAINDTLLAHEAAMRMIVRNALDLTIAASDDTPSGWAAAAGSSTPHSSPFEPELDADVLDILREALALVIGPEAILAARDVCGLSPARTREVTRWATEALIAHRAIPIRRDAPRGWRAMRFGTLGGGARSRSIGTAALAAHNTFRGRSSTSCTPVHCIAGGRQVDTRRSRNHFRTGSATTSASNPAAVDGPTRVTPASSVTSGPISGVAVPVAESSAGGK